MEVHVSSKNAKPQVLRPQSKRAENNCKNPKPLNKALELAYITGIKKLIQTAPNDKKTSIQ